MANYEATKYNFDGANLTAIEGIPTATIVPWSDSSVPSGFLECNGAAVSRSTYSALFAVVGTTYGAGDGSSTFNVPVSPIFPCWVNPVTKALASTGGANTVAATGNVSGSTGNHSLSTSELASHSHPNAAGGRPNAQGNTEKARSVTSSSTGSGSAHSHNMSATFAGNATSVLQPYLTVLYIIKT